MATAKELEFKPGDIAVWGSATKELPPFRPYGIPGILGGIPLDTPGAKVKFTVGKVVNLGVPWGASTATELEVLWTNDPDDLPVGVRRLIDSGFVNFIHEGDERLNKQMVNAGYRLEIKEDPNGNISYQVAPINSDEPTLLEYLDSLEHSQELF